MAMGSGSGISGDINVTPLVDVVLVLLIIFMVTTPVLQMGLDVEVPPKVEMTEPPPESMAVQLVIDVRPDGFWLNQEKMGALTDGELRTLRDHLAPLMISRPEAERVVFINASDAVAFEQAVRAMDVAHSAGAQKIGFLTEQVGGS
jgi:biopolymer transport protein ExbD